MAAFEVERRTRHSAEAAWARLTDWKRHGDAIALTRVFVTPTSAGRTGLVSGFVARTSLGPLHFDDPMEVTYWRPPENGSPGVCRIVKRGKVVTGWAVLTVTPAANGCSVRWREDAAIRFVGPLLAWPTRLVASRVFGRLVDRLLEG